MFILTHPDNIELLKNSPDIIVKKLNKQIGVSPRDYSVNLNNIRIVGNENLQRLEPNGKWRRSKTHPDDKFCEWIDDMENPPSWAIYFDLVEPDGDPIFYIQNQATVFTPQGMRKQSW